jgi:D-alanyl-lipoteichoic acid acyltransferase DltB (MBOAT superfamily)
LVFSDPVFLLLFVPLSVAAHRAALRISEAAAQWVLVLASLVFYSAWDMRWLPLLLGTIAFNIVLGRALMRHKKRSLMIAGVLANLAPLLIAKYAGWLTAGHLFADIALPLGISFFTFQQIGFVVDAYQGKVREVSVRHYTLFVTFFSQLVAGPIVHHSHLCEQFRKPFSFDEQKLMRALVLIIAGLFKKVVIADRLAPYATHVFDGTGAVTVYEAWIGVLAYTFQLYFDFAGYCEMAMGLALLFGYHIPINFLSPYKARSITEFWRTWHVTLGGFFRQYCYAPLGGNRHGPARMYVALFVTAFVSGIWHGAGMTFLIWGVMHGSALVVQKFFSRSRFSMPSAAQLLLTFGFVTLAWVMFRAPNVDVALNVYASLVGANGYIAPALFADIVGVSGATLSSMTGFEVFTMAGLLWWVWRLPNVHEVAMQPTRRMTAGLSTALVLVLVSITGPSPNIYWKF